MNTDMRAFLTQQLQLSQDFLQPLHFSLERPRALYALFTRMGWNLEGLLDVDPQPLTVSIEAAQVALETLVAAAQAPDSQAVAVSVHAAIGELLTCINDVRDAVAQATVPGLEDDVALALADDLVNYLILRWLARHVPELTSLGRLLSVVKLEQRPPLRGPANQLLRFPVARWVLNLDDIWTVIANPLGSLLRAMPQEIPTTPEGYVDALGDLIRAPLRELVTSFGDEGVGDWAVTLDAAGIQVASARLAFATNTTTPINFVWPDAPNPMLTLSPGVWRLDWTVPALTSGVSQSLVATDFFTLSAPLTGGGCDPPSLTLAVRNQRLLLETNGALRLDLNTLSGPTYGEICLRLNYVVEGTTIQLSGTLVWDTSQASDAIEIGLPGFDIITLSFGDAALGAELGISVDLYPQFSLSIGPMDLYVNVKTDVLRPVERVNPDSDGAPLFRVIENTRLSILLAPIVVSFNLSGDITIESDYSASLPPTMIGSTGIVVEAENLRLVLSERDAAALGGSASPDARGLFVDGATIYLPKGLAVAVPSDITIDDCIIGPAGFSGRFEGHGVFTITPDGKRFEGPGAGEVFGVPFGLENLVLEFVDNVPIEARVGGQIILPYFDQAISLSIEIDLDGNFLVSINAATPPGLVVRRDELIELTLRSLALGTVDDGVGVTVSGGLRPLLMASDGLEWPTLDVKGLYIDNTGKFRIDEAWLDMTELQTLDLWGFPLELSRIGLGYQETDDKLWIDLSGSLRLIEQIPVGLGVEGFRLTWPRTLFEQLAIDEPPTLDKALAIASELEVKFDGVHLFYGIPGAIEFEGSLGFIKSAQVVGFRGDMALRVPATGLAIEAGLMVGINFETPPYPFLLLTFGVQLPAGIPLAQSGLALKGAQGLFGLNVSPNRTADQNWYYDWYKRDPLGADKTSKWQPERNALALGMGLTITTVDGYIKGVRGLLVLAIPGPILIIEGRALIFDGLTPAEPPLRALAVIDGKEETIQFNIEAEAVLIEDMLDAYGMLEAFFDFNDLTNWHMYLGQDEPIDRRIQANVLKFKDAFLFKADAYLMVDMIGSQTLRSRMGVFIGFKPPAINFDPVTITLDAVLEGRGNVTVLPAQFSGEVNLSANIELKVFDFGLQLTAVGGVLTEGPKPLKVDAEVIVSVELPLPLGDFSETLQFSWEAPEPPEITPPLVAVTADSPFVPGGGALPIFERIAVESQSNWRQAAENSPVAPIDTRPVLSFNHEMNDEARVPDSRPQPAFARHPNGTAKTYDVGLMQFTPTLTTVRLYEHRKGEPWPNSLEDWRSPGLVATSLADDPKGETPLLPGVWMAEADPQGPDQPPTRQLHLWTNNPLLHAAQTLDSGYRLPFDPSARGRQQSGRSHAKQLLDLHPNLMECANTEPQPVCVNFVGQAGTRLEPDIVWEHQGLRFKFLGSASVQVQRPPSPRLDLLLRSQIQMALLRIDVRFLNPLLINEQALLAWAGSVQVGQQNQIRQRHPNLRAVWDWLWPSATGQTCLNGQGHLSIRFPKPVSQVWIRFCQLPKVKDNNPSSVLDTARAARTPNELTEIADAAKRKGIAPDYSICKYPVAHQVSVADDNWIISTNESFDCLEAFKTEDFAIAEICYLTAKEKERAARAAAQCETNLGGDGEPQNLLQPGSYYRLEIETKVGGKLGVPNDPLYGPILEQLGFDDAAKAYQHVAFFQTEGPPTSLERYIKWSNPQQQSTRVFRRDSFAIRFLRPNIKEMYAHPPHMLEMLIRSTEGHLMSGYTTAWSKAGSASLLHEEQLWREHRRKVGLTNAAVEADDVLELRRVSAELEPNARYELLVSGGEGGTLLFQDGFEGLSGETWKPNVTGWTAQAGVLTRQEDSPAHLTTGNPNWTNLELVVELKLTNNRAGGVLVRAVSTSRQAGNPVWNACRISLSRNRFGVLFLHMNTLRGDLVDGGSLVTSILRRTSNPDPGLWNRLRVSLVANRLRVWLFENLLIEGTLYQMVRDWTTQNRPSGTLLFFENKLLDAEHQQALQRGDLLPSMQGQVGLYAASERTEFRRMSVRDAVLQRVSFTTSAFAGFRELVQSGEAYDPLSITATTPATQVQQTALQAAQQLAHESGEWHHAQIDYRFETLDRKGLEERKLALREARANHDAAFRSLAETVAQNLYYLPFAPHVELYLLRNDNGEMFGLWLRSPESLDLWQDVRDANSNKHVGRTRISLTPSLGSEVQIFHDADSSQIIIFLASNAVWPNGSYQLTFTYHRKHGDEVGEGDHRYDSPMEVGGDMTNVETVSIAFTI